LISRTHNTNYLRNATIGLALIATLATAGCNVGPKYTRPVVPAPPAFRGADEAQIASDAKDSLGDQQWSQVFHEPELQDLIRQALANNYDLKIAAEKVLEQQQQVRITRSQQFPQVSASLSGAGTNESSALTTAPVSFGLTASWTPDFWGLYRKQTEAQRDQLLAQQWAQRAVRVSLVEEVASTYFQLRALDAQLAVSRDTLKARQDSLDLTNKLQTGGNAPLSDVRQAEQLLYTAAAQIPALEEQIQQQENAMRLLLGQAPGSVTHTDAAALSPVPQDLPVGLPSQLLERRPDIEQVEAQLRAANANIGVARAQFFPQLTLSGEGGAGGETFNSLVGIVLGSGSITQPIFEGGKLRAQLELSKAQQDELVLTYQKTILGAFRDVSNALIAVNKTRAAREQQQKLVDAAQDATRLARVRYQGGASSYLEVLTNDSNLFTAQLNLISAEQAEALSLVQLYQALGGGWQA